MKEFKGTKGEWKKEVKYRGGLKRPLINVVLPNGRTLNLGQIEEDECNVETCCCLEAHTNANLIAAAPELLEALQELVNVLSDPEYKIDSFTTQPARDAITKALGQ